MNELKKALGLVVKAREQIAELLGTCRETRGALEAANVPYDLEVMVRLGAVIASCESLDLRLSLFEGVIRSALAAYSRAE